ncbi:MAG: PEP-CTERM sorting domain-containing protein [Phycisphaerales bacterium]|jgi:hypothetical protein
MRPLIFAAAAALLLTTPLLAENSLHFSTKPGAAYAWELSWTGSQWQLSFVDDAIVVDGATPTDTTLTNDYVLLPTMNVSGLSDRGSMLAATLNPNETFRIQSDTDRTDVLTATMGSGSMLAVGTNTIAYSQINDDLRVDSHTQNYSTVLSGLVSDQQQGLLLDLSFSGDAIQGASLYNLLRSNQGVARGTICGQISSIPEPATLLILGLGAAIANHFRSRRRK